MFIGCVFKNKIFKPSVLDFNAAKFNHLNWNEKYPRNGVMLANGYSKIQKKTTELPSYKRNLSCKSVGICIVLSVRSLTLLELKEQVSPKLT